MRLTRKTNYAVRILMYCAANSDSLSRVPRIAAAYELSELFLFKILKPLIDNGFVESVRGRNGGIRLAKSADRISLLEIVRVTEDNFTMADCFEEGGSNCPLIDACALNSAWNEALSAFFSVLQGYTIADLVEPSLNIGKLLGLNKHGKLSA